MFYFLITGINNTYKNFSFFFTISAPLLVTAPLLFAMLATFARSREKAREAKEKERRGKSKLIEKLKYI